MSASHPPIALPVEPELRACSELDANREDNSPEDVGEMFSAYRLYVAKIGRRILGNQCDIEDLIQDVFEATLRDIHNLRDPERLRAWLGTVTTRLAKRRRFRNSVQPARPDGDGDLEQLLQHVSEEGPGPESKADLSGDIRKVLSMPDELRTPWVLKHVEGRTLQDVARQCDCSLSTAQRRIQSVSDRIARRRG
jgi:RNA polymerase sigma factor (sigma-70 family)